MVWRGSTDVKDRIFGALVYILPLIVVFPFSFSLLKLFPQLSFIYLPLRPLMEVYYGFPFAGFIIFLLLFMAVVRNDRISHFIRFNTMQSILLDILIVLCSLIINILFAPLGAQLLTQTISNAIFLGTLVACFYGIIQSALGKYAEIPTISEAAYSQVRW